ncbi:MAG: rhodanese-like domain-containing protein [bacterium]
MRRLGIDFCVFILLLGCVSKPVGPNKIETIQSMYEEYRTSFPDVPEISVEDLLGMQKERELTLVDVRDAAERRVSIIPNAISREEFERDMEKYKNDTVVVYCTIGHRSGLYAQELMNKDLRVFNLKGGVLSWAHTGQDFVNDKGKTRTVHVYGPEWNLLPEGYTGVW